MKYLTLLVVASGLFCIGLAYAQCMVGGTVDLLNLSFAVALPIAALALFRWTDAVVRRMRK